MNVPYKLGEGGSTILVPSNVVGDYQDEAGDAGPSKAGASGTDHLYQQKFGTTALQEQVNLQRDLEGELVKSIQSINAVQTARVHLAIPRQTIFLREHQKRPATAASFVSTMPRIELVD